MAIEFALVLPFILMFLFAIIEFGQIFNHFNDANQIAAIGARFAAVDSKPTAATLQEYLRDQADTQHLKDNMKVCIDFPNNTSNVGDPVRVTVRSSYEIAPIVVWKTLFDRDFDLKGSATMRIERPPTTYTAGNECAATP